MDFHCTIILIDHVEIHLIIDLTEFNYIKNIIWIKKNKFLLKFNIYYNFDFEIYPYFIGVYSIKITTIFYLITN